MPPNHKPQVRKEQRVKKLKLSQVKNLEKMQLKGLRIFFIVNSTWYFT